MEDFRLYNACMISREGKVYSVEAHPYMDYDIIPMNLEAGLWFYEHTFNEVVKQAYIDLLSYYVKSEYGSIDALCSVNISVLEELKSFIQEHITDLKNSFNNCDRNKKEILDVLVNGLNQEFMRVRYGGIYKTVEGVREMYFRISSTEFNWFDIIREYVITHKDFIDYVTVVSDLASTGSGEFYSSKNGVYDNMPVDDFLDSLQNVVILEYFDY